MYTLEPRGGMKITNVYHLQCNKIYKNQTQLASYGMLRD